MINWKGLEGSKGGLSEILSWHSPGRSEENNEDHQTGQSLSWQRFEPSIFWI
jgi:hypothetical protein